ncbi:MAG: T9SS type A sorting domain-containing protein [Ginsengibacter sp.]
MVDADGRFTYSKTIAITAPMSNAITVFPNPVKDKLFIRLAGAPAGTEITMADTKGNCVIKLQLKAGTIEASVNTSALPAGVYSISFQSGNLKNTQQFIKE